MAITAIVGEQRGDEGKGRFVDMLMPEHDIGARFGGGDNAGHTVVDPEGTVFKLHGLPSSIVHEHAMSVIGNGAVINAVRLTSEMSTLQEQGVHINEDNLLISGGAHLTLPHHISEDEIREAGADGQGSTKSGIAQVYASKTSRLGIRAEIIKNDPALLHEIVIEGLKKQRDARSEAGLDPLDEEYIAKEYVSRAKQLGEYVTDTALYLNEQLHGGKKVLAEGAQAFLLDIDHGMYPYVTSSSTTVGGVATGLGVPPHHIECTIGVSKAVQSHVGGGPFVTEIHDPQLLNRLHGDKESVDAERGTTTGRTRRLGYLDLPQIRRAQMVNGTDKMALTKLDWIPRFGEEVPICVAYERKGKELDVAPDAAYKLEQSTSLYYETLPTWPEDIRDTRHFEDLPQEAQNYISFIENELNIGIDMIGVGPARDQVIVR